MTSNFEIFIEVLAELKVVSYLSFYSNFLLVIKVTIKHLFVHEISLVCAFAAELFLQSLI